MWKAESLKYGVYLLWAEGKVRSQQGVDIPIKADTICIHGDGPYALVFARLIYQEFQTSGIKIEAVGHKIKGCEYVKGSCVFWVIRILGKRLI